MRFSCLLLVLSVLCFPASADNVAVQPKGQYATIDTSQAIKTMQLLLKGSGAQRGEAIDAVIAHADRYAPPVFYALSHALFEDGKKDEGAFWFYAGQ